MLHIKIKLKFERKKNWDRTILCICRHIRDLKKTSYGSRSSVQTLVLKFEHAETSAHSNFNTAVAPRFEHADVWTGSGWEAFKHRQVQILAADLRTSIAIKCIRFYAPKKLVFWSWTGIAFSRCVFHHHFLAWISRRWGRHGCTEFFGSRRCRELIVIILHLPVVRVLAEQVSDSSGWSRGCVASVLYGAPSVEPVGSFNKPCPGLNMFETFIFAQGLFVFRNFRGRIYVA